MIHDNVVSKIVDKFKIIFLKDLLNDITLDIETKLLAEMDKTSAKFGVNTTSSALYKGPKLSKDLFQLNFGVGDDFDDKNINATSIIFSKNFLKA